MLSILPVHGEVLTVAVIRVEFQTDDSPATAGDGSFILQDTMSLECSEWTLDPPPHNATYFRDHLLSANNYWQQVSNGNVSIDTVNSKVFPENDSEAYVLPQDMLYYHPYLEDYDETGKLFELSRDALLLADPDIDFSAFSTVILVHAGMGGDFAFALDPTPGNIPSAYLSKTDFDEYNEYFIFDGVQLRDVIILPESQNFQQYEETISLFEDTGDPCFYQVGLNGTMALMLGFHLDLPPMYNTETGRSLVGGFALMDQGSNNFHGIAPAYPDPYTRIEKGWTTPDVKTIGDTVSIAVDDPPVRINISDDEYYLIENRQRNMVTPANMTVWIDSLISDTVSVIPGQSGVVIDVDEQHAGLPGNGLHIWHIDESAEFTEQNPNGGPVQLVDFLEADGAQDMGFTTQLLFADFLETGWWFDPWFAGNEGWFHLNRNQAVVGDSLLYINSSTFPSTNANNGVPSHLAIENISRNGSRMSFSIASDRMVSTESVSSIIGWRLSERTLWAFNHDSTAILECDLDSGRIVITGTSPLNPDNIFQPSIDNSYTYGYGLIAPRTESGVLLYDIEDGSLHHIPQIDSLFELRQYTEIMYFAKQDDEYVSVMEKNGETTITPLPAYPLATFTLADTLVYYGDREHVFPASVRNSHLPTDDAIVSWSADNESLVITKISDGSERYISVEKPLHIIPMDTDNNGIFEIALFYGNMIKIINQSGISWDGSPFMVGPYYGNPIITTIYNDELGIFLRHEDHYAVYGINGAIQDQGVMPDISEDIDNSIRRVSEYSYTSNGAFNYIFNYILSGSELLYFDLDALVGGEQFWVGSQGSVTGERIALLSGIPDSYEPDVKTESAYNYPNPIKGNNTTIRAWLGDVEAWTIEIFSLNGAQIKYVEQDVMQKNTYNEYVWDASAVSNGVYVAQIVAGDQSEIIKIAVIR